MPDPVVLEGMRAMMRREEKDGARRSDREDVQREPALTRGNKHVTTRSRPTSFDLRHHLEVPLTCEVRPHAGAWDRGTRVGAGLSEVRARIEQSLGYDQGFAPVS